MAVSLAPAVAVLTFCDGKCVQGGRKVEVGEIDVIGF
jgi:hypothetical protein